VGEHIEHSGDGIQRALFVIVRHHLVRDFIKRNKVPALRQTIL